MVLILAQCALHPFLSLLVSCAVSDPLGHFQSNRHPFSPSTIRFCPHPPSPLQTCSFHTNQELSASWTNRRCLSSPSVLLHLLSSQPWPPLCIRSLAAICQTDAGIRQSGPYTYSVSVTGQHCTSAFPINMATFVHKSALLPPRATMCTRSHTLSPLLLSASL